MLDRGVDGSLLLVDFVAFGDNGVLETGLLRPSVCRCGIGPAMGICVSSTEKTPEDFANPIWIITSIVLFSNKEKGEAHRLFDSQC